MSIFDTFIKRDDSSTGRANSDNLAEFTPQGSANTANMPENVRPTSFKDVYMLLDQLRLGKTIIVDCSQLKQASAIRIIDILSGATYCLNGGWKAVAPEIFMFAPNNSFGSTF